MKQIINPAIQPDTIHLSELKDTRTKCVVWQSTAKWAPKTELAKLQMFYHTDKKPTYGFAQLENACSGVCGFEHASPEEAIKTALTYGNVFVFDDFREALEWMASLLK